MYTYATCRYTSRGCNNTRVAGNQVSPRQKAQKTPTETGDATESVIAVLLYALISF